MANEPQEKLSIGREFFVEVDSLMSLVAYRYASGLPADVVEKLKTFALVARKLYEGKD